MALTGEDKQWIKETIQGSETSLRGELQRSIQESETNLRSELQRSIQESETNLRGELQQSIKESESNLLEGIRYNRGEIKALQLELKGLREKLESYNSSRTEDSDAAFSDIHKYVQKIKSLEKRVKKLEAQLT
ncbi:hypothetical protein FWD20_02145 [Candidatus Saccharibacteria bacterium]|nr:hypothetical protein [Candidatus Saccharibacteria bacterium]